MQNKISGCWKQDCWWTRHWQRESKSATAHQSPHKSQISLAQITKRLPILTKLIKSTLKIIHFTKPCKSAAQEQFPHQNNVEVCSSIALGDGHEFLCRRSSATQVGGQHSSASIAPGDGHIHDPIYTDDAWDNDLDNSAEPLPDTVDDDNTIRPPTHQSLSQSAIIMTKACCAVVQGEFKQLMFNLMEQSMPFCDCP